MAQLDRFFQVLFERQAQDLRMRTHGGMVLGFADGERPIYRKPLDPSTLSKLLREVMEPEVFQQLRAQQRVLFSYASPHGPVRGEVQLDGGELTATFRPQIPAAPAPPAVPDVVDPMHVSPSPPTISDDLMSLITAPEVASTSGALELQLPPPPQELTGAARPAVVGPGAHRPAIEPLLELMLAQRASDLHLTSEQQPYLRIDGAVQPVPGRPRLDGAALMSMLMEIAPPRNRDEFVRRNDTDFAYELGARARFRVNVFRDRFGVGAVLRWIPTQILTCEQLGVPAAVRELCKLNKGFVVVTGPTGSGKSTTLAALIDLINQTRADHIITIEDPIEFVHANKKCLIHQREVHAHTDSFRDALRAALREDPDIVLVGEMRDLETISIAIETAETGHLVFGTLHTNTAPSTVDRIIDQFPADRQAQIRTMLSESLRGVVSQTLLRKQEGGRVAAYEVLICGRAVRNLIREGKTFQLYSVMQTQKAAGNLLLNDSLLELVKSGTVAAEEAYFKAVDKEMFLGMLRRANLKVEGIIEKDLGE